MLNFRLSLYRSQKEALEKRIAAARKLGNIPLLNKALAILAKADGICPTQVANTLKISAESIRLWLCSFLLFGVSSLNANKSPERPPKLTKKQKKELAKIIHKGPSESGFMSNCWRSPMVQDLIFDRLDASQLVLMEQAGVQVLKYREPHWYSPQCRADRS